MLTDIGELIVGAYLQVIVKCDVVDYNVRTKDGGLEGLGELDVIGFDFSNSTAYLCEVTTHIHGLRYGSSNEETVKKIKKKHQRQKEYAEKYLKNFKNHKFMFWSPRVPVGYMTDAFEKIDGMEFVINTEYTEKIEELKIQAGKETHDVGNPFYRMLQIMTHLKERS